MDLTNDDVADILALLDSLPYDEFDLQTPRFRLTLRRGPDGAWTQESQVLSDPHMSATRPAVGVPTGDKAAGAGTAAGMVEAASAGGTASASATDGADARLVAVAAPLPGTFYRAPRPGAAPFVEVGDAVSEDTVVAIVETMKLMNSVHAGARGRVSQIRFDNAEPVTQGVTLMLIEPEPA
jgi:acetyl-CoA carboxylase biotin carboxyl carrier protein